MTTLAPGGHVDEARRYVLESRIATGGMGEVWSARDTVLDRPVAVKVLKAEYADDALFRTRFETEARHAAALHHPGIASVFDYGASTLDDGSATTRPYLVMELVEGQPLSALLRPDAPLDPEVAQQLLAQAADALGVAHAAGIVHRDVKPANLLVTPDRRVKVTDFGIARAAEGMALTQTGEVMGTPAYISPEQAEGGTATAASDVYSLGVVAFECLVGRKPFTADTPVGTAIAHLREPVPELPDRVPAALAGVVRRALAKSPAERYPDGAAFARALRAPSADDGATVVAPLVPPAGLDDPGAAGRRAGRRLLPQPRSPPRRRPRPARRRTSVPWPLVIGIAAVLAAVLLAVWLGTRDDSEPTGTTTQSPQQSQSPSPSTSPTESPSQTPTETPDPDAHRDPHRAPEPTTVEVDPAAYVGRTAKDVEKELRDLGLEPELVELENPGDAENGRRGGRVPEWHPRRGHHGDRDLLRQARQAHPAREGQEAMTQPEPTLIGGRYELGELLGRGGMAEVRKGKDRRLGRTVAVKRLRTDLASDATFQARFRREAQSSASLNHPAIVSTYDTGEEMATDGSGVAQPYIVMECVEGRTLRDILREGRKILPERALEITAGVLSALDYSHRAGIIHRDIKPGNVMLTPSGDVKVMDFGIARAISDASSTMTQTAAVVGTAQYLSPEQARGETVDSRSDVYSTGCLLYELLTGRPPFVGDSPVAVAYQHVREPASPPSDLDDQLDPEIDAIVMKSLAKRVEDRYQSAAAMKADIERYLSGHPIQAPAVLPVAAETQHVPPVPPADATSTFAPGPPPQQDQPRRSRTGWWVLAGFLVVLLLGLGAWALNGVLFDDAPERERSPTWSGSPRSRRASRSSTPGSGSARSTGRPRRRSRPTRSSPRTPAATSSSTPAARSTSCCRSGKPEVEVPYVVGTLRKDARAAMLEQNLKVRFQEEDSDEPRFQVLSTTPAAGTPVAEGTTVTVVFSDGPEKVPDVRGLKQGAAERAIREAGFVPGRTHRRGVDRAQGHGRGPDPGGRAPPTRAARSRSSSPPTRSRRRPRRRPRPRRPRRRPPRPRRGADGEPDHAATAAPLTLLGAVGSAVGHRGGVGEVEQAGVGRRRRPSRARSCPTRRRRRGWSCSRGRSPGWGRW